MTTCTTISIFNHKGGVGKTTTAVNLAASLVHAHKKRVLVIDMDAQANATRALIGKEFGPDRLTMRHVLLPDSSSPVTLADVLMNTALPGLCVAPADLSLSEAELKLVSKPGREFVLKQALTNNMPEFDFVILDCPPSLGLLSLNALAAADYVLIPCETQFLSLRGLRYVLDVVRLVQEKLNPNLRVLGVLPTKFYVLSTANNEALKCLRELKEVHVFGTEIARDVRAEEAPSHGRPLVLYAPDSRAAQQYVKLSDEVTRLCDD